MESMECRTNWYKSGLRVAKNKGPPIFFLFTKQWLYSLHTQRPFEMHDSVDKIFSLVHNCPKPRFYVAWTVKLMRFAMCSVRVYSVEWGLCFLWMHCYTFLVLITINKNTKNVLTILWSYLLKYFIYQPPRNMLRSE